MQILHPIYSHNRERIAARAGRTLITYGRLCADIDTMAQWLLDQGLLPGDRVTLHPNHLANPSYWDWIAQLGAIRAGLVHSTGDIPAEVTASGAIGPHAAAIGKVGKLAPHADPRLKLAFAPASSAPLAQQIQLKTAPRELAGLEAQSVRLLSTSGTTGTPKVVKWDAPLFAGRLEQVRETGDITPDTIILTLLGLITTTGLRYPLAAWQIGATVLLPTMGEEQPNFPEIAGASTFLASSPFRIQELLSFVPGEWPGSDKRVIELFGGRVPPLLRKALLAKCCTSLRMSYGATEVGRVAAGDAALVSRNPGAVGMTEPGVTVQIVDAEGIERPSGEPGIVRLKSAFMCDGYLGLPPFPGQKAPFRDGWFYPGDIGILYPDGLFAITGRSSETINLAGAKLSPVLLEERIGKLPEVKDSCVVAMQLDHGDVLGVALVLQPGQEISQIRAKIGAVLPPHISFVLFNAQSIPRNAMGRIPRQAVALELTKRLQRKEATRQASLNTNNTDRMVAEEGLEPPTRGL
ncbi:acyl--CoA ligase [Altererythrobacter sp. CC-YST694]|uniref:class I adenylate-forming enzyme family protein n=1 Tax=Altererythrobacter sp. CC-YST694 TaxID=2755038 RepID=UPI001D010DEC|nr:acyl--CoA ligase [Altererythrobacter sp. CC-YST694]